MIQWDVPVASHVGSQRSVSHVTWGSPLSYASENKCRENIYQNECQDVSKGGVVSVNGMVRECGDGRCG